MAGLMNTRVEKKKEVIKTMLGYFALPIYELYCNNKTVAKFKWKR